MSLPKIITTTLGGLLLLGWATDVLADHKSSPKVITTAEISSNKLDVATKKALEQIKEEVNEEYGFLYEKPRINRGPCGVFAQIFCKKWNELFEQKIHICFVMTQSMNECDHVLIRLPSGELYDGGIGVHADSIYLPKFLIKDMIDYDETVLEKWSYGLNRTYPESCPNFNRKTIEHIVHLNLENLAKKSIDP